MSLADEILGGSSSKQTNKSNNKNNNKNNSNKKKNNQTKISDEIFSGNYSAPKQTTTVQQKQSTPKQTVKLTGNKFLDNAIKNANNTEKNEAIKQQVQALTNRWNSSPDKKTVLQQVGNYVTSGDALDDATKLAKKGAMFATNKNYRNQVIKKGLNSAAVAIPQLAKGIIKTGENWYDTLQTADFLVNEGAARKLGITSEEDYQKKKQKLENKVKDDWTGNLWKYGLGWDEDVDKFLEKNSYITGSNMPGQLVESVGQQLPAMAIGQAGMDYMLGGNAANSAFQSLKGLRGVERAKAVGTNLTRAAAINSASNAEIFARSYGAAAEEALQQGASLEQASKYGVLKSLAEIGTEWVTSGIPGVEESTGLLSNGASKLLDKTTGKIKKEPLRRIVRNILEFTGGMAGEGFEEALSEVISPYIKNATYTQGEKVNLNDVVTSFLTGAASSGLLDFGGNVANRLTRRNANIQNNELAQQQVNQIQEQVQNGEITPQEGTQQINDIQNYLKAQEAQTEQTQEQPITPQETTQTTPTINETTQDNINAQEQQNVPQNRNNEVEEKPTNVGKHYGDLGKAHDTNYFAMNGSRRGTGHFGTGTYFVSGDYEVGPDSTYAKRPINYSNFDDYNLARPATDQDGFDLHDALKQINYNNSPVNEELYNKLLPYYEASFGTTNDLLSDESIDNYKNIRNLLEQAGVETEEFNGDSYSRYERDLEDKITDVLNDYDRFGKAEKDLKRILGVSDEQFNNAIEKVRQVKNEYNNYNDDQKLTADSLSTIFMKELGYEGVDVRHLKGLNDTEFGSVIYDLKDNKRETNSQAPKAQKAEETFKNIKTKEDMDKLISNLKDKVENIKTGEDLKNTFKEIYDIYKVYNKSNDIYEVVEKDGLYGTKFESEFYNPDIKYKPLNEEIKIQKENLESWLRIIKDNSEEIIYNNQDKVTPTIGKNINSLDEVTPITTDDFKNKLHDYINKETEDIKGKFESKDGHLYRGGKEVNYLYRAINQEEMDSIKNSGYIKSNQSKNIGYEIEQGLTDFKDGYPGFYLPRNADGYIIKIEVKPENGFFYDSDEYAKTPNQIPASQIVEINGEKINKTNAENTPQQTNIPETKTEPVVKFDNETKKQTAKQITDVLNKNLENNENADIFDTIEKDTGKKLRGFVKTATNATGDVDLVSKMDKVKITYDQLSNKETMKQAENYFKDMKYQDGVEDVLDFIKSDKRVTALDMAKIDYMVLQAKARNDMRTYQNLVEEAGIIATQSGQVSQAVSLIQQSDPMYQLSALNRLIQKEQENGTKQFKGVKIKENLVEKVMDSYDENGNFDKKKFDKAMDNLKQDIANQMKVTPMEKADAWRYLSMLGNPKTHIRNITANVAMKLLQGTKNKIASAGEALVDVGSKAIGKEGIQRTKTLMPSTRDVKSYASQTMDSYFEKNDQGSKYNDKITNKKGLKGELLQRRNKFSNKNPVGFLLNLADKGNSAALNWEDNVFNKSAAKSAMSNYLTANGIRTQADIDAHPDIVQAAFDYGILQGQEATFHQKSTTADVIRQSREKLRTGSGLSKAVGYGIDATMPFVSTPVNIAKTGVEYTPGLGLLKTITDVQQAPKAQKASVFIDSLSKQLSGGLLAYAGYLLAKNGWLVGGGDDDDSEKKLEKNLGAMNYSIKIGNDYYDISFLSPSAMPLLMGANLNEALKGKGVKEKVIADVLYQSLDPLTEMSFMSSVQDVLKSYNSGAKGLSDMGSSALTGYISQYIPTLMSQFASSRDKYERSKGGNTFIEKTKQKLMYKVPGLREQLPKKVNVWGEAKENYRRGLEAFLNPMNRSTAKIDNTTKEIEKIYEETGTGMPNMGIKEEQLGNTLNQKEYTQFKKTYGKTAKKELDDLIKSSKYKNASTEEKAAMITRIYSYSTHKSKEEYSNKSGVEYEPQTKYYAMIDAFDIPFNEYVQMGLEDIKADKGSNGKSISGSKKTKVIKAIEESGLTKVQKQAIIKQKGYKTSKNDDYELKRAIYSSNIGDEEKNKILEYLKLK